MSSPEQISTPRRSLLQSSSSGELKFPDGGNLSLLGRCLLPCCHVLGSFVLGWLLNRLALDRGLDSCRLLSRPGPSGSLIYCDYKVPVAGKLKSQIGEFLSLLGRCLLFGSWLIVLGAAAEAPRSCPWRRLPSSIVSTVQSKRPPRRSWSKVKNFPDGGYYPQTCWGAAISDMSAICSTIADRRSASWPRLGLISSIE